MRKLLTLGAIALLSVTGGLAQKANRTKQGEGHNDVFTAGSTDDQVAQKVRHNLLMLPYYSIFDDLTFRVDPGGVVTLEGACPSDPPWDIKSDAQHAAEKVPGVTKVVNQIRELPVSPMDWDIRRAEARAIYGNPDIGTRYGFQAVPSVHIIVDNGHVTLDGVVDNQMDDTLIKTRANSVPNVFSVTDNLVVLNKGKDKK